MASREYKFVRELADVLKCGICLGVARDPHQHEECGKLFCKECIDKFGRDKCCPHCRTRGSQYFRDNKSKYIRMSAKSSIIVPFLLGRREIQDIPIHCDNDERGCKWEETLGALAEHVVTCGFTLVPCPKECEDEDGVAHTFLRKDIANHLEDDCPNRDCVCEHCGEEGTFQYITDIHDDECNKKVVPCPNAGCCEVMPREDLDDHDDECEHAIISCKYDDIGCEKMMERGNMTTHEQDDSFHLHMALDAVVKLKGTVNYLQYRLEDAEDQLKMCSSKTFALHGYMEKKEVNEVFTSPSVYTSPRGCKLQLEIYVNGHDRGKGTHMSIYPSLLKDENAHSLSGEVTITLLNQLADENHHTKTMSTNILNINRFLVKRRRRIESHGNLHKYALHSILSFNPEEYTQYLKDDTLYFRVSFQEESGKPWLRCN